MTTSSEILLTTCISPFISFETCFVTCWMILILSNLSLRSEIVYQMFSSWWYFGEVCVSCAKRARSCCLVLKFLKFSLYLVLNEKIQYGDLKALGWLSYQIVWPSEWARDHLRKTMSNTVILKLRGVCRTQSCDPPCGLEIIWGLKMSKLLNLIEILVAYVSIWQSSRIELLLLTLRWYLSYLYMLVLLEFKVLMLVVTLLKLLHRLISYLAPCYMLVIY
jgi:hypothetical protein